jgi:hypothetical protein
MPKPKKISRYNPKTLSALVFVMFFGVVGLHFLLPSFAATPTLTEPAQGLIIQVSSLAPTVTPTTLKTWLEQIRRDHRTKTRPGYINSVVVQDIADQNGTLLTNYLDVLAPYLPGGATPAFDRAFLGTVDLAWTGGGSKYIEGIESPAFRATNVTLSQTAAKAYKARYPQVKADWYITYEANLAGFWDQNIQQAYLTYINQLIPALSTISAGKAYLWSPSFWTAYKSQPAWAIPSLQQNLGDLFGKTTTPLTLDLQDFVGQSNGGSTKEDAAVWVNYLKQNYSTKLAKVQINTEQFKQNSDGSIVVGDAIELPTRESYYAKQGIELGPSWELRYWHKRLYGK